MIKEQNIYNDSLEYFSDLKKSIDNAKKEVLIETYIFDNHIGLEIINLLKDKKDITRKILIDGIGSYNIKPSILEEARVNGIEIKFYSPLPWQIKSSTIERMINSFIFIFKFLNRRNHKKLYIIDNEAFMGSLNIDSRQLQWKESGIKIKGNDINFLKASFYHNWKRTFYFSNKKRKALKESFSHPKIKYKYNLSSRRAYFKELINYINNAKNEILITNPYFVPRPKLIASLIKAKKRGVNIKLLVPQISDQFYFPIVNATSFYPLLKKDIEVYEYKEKILHAKEVIIDDIAIIGSSNLNQRSFFFDKELDIIIDNKELVSQLKGTFENDLTLSDIISIPLFKEKYLKKIWLLKPLFWLRKFL